MEHTRAADVAVSSLADHPEAVIPLARIRWNEWGSHAGREDLQWWVDTTRSESGSAGMPVTFVATDAAGETIGGVGLVAVEHRERSDRSPWVVGTIVRPDRRNQGIGATLMAGLTTWATTAGIEQLWVATGRSAVGFYQQCGFTFVEVAQLPHGDRPTILTARLPRDAETNAQTV